MPIRIEIGSKEQSNNTVYMGRRDKAYRDKTSLTRQEFIASLRAQLDEMQANLFSRAQQFQRDHITIINNQEDFYTYFKNDSGFALAYFNCDQAVEKKLKAELSVTVRCIPFQEKDNVGKCIFTDKPNAQAMLFAKAY